jgi:hypothetical protein
MALDERHRGFGEVMICCGRALWHLHRDVLGHLATPAFSDVEGDDVKRSVELPTEEVADDRLAIRQGRSASSLSQRHSVVPLICATNPCATAALSGRPPLGNASRAQKFKLQ